MRRQRAPARQFRTLSVENVTAQKGAVEAVYENKSCRSILCTLARRYDFGLCGFYGFSGQPVRHSSNIVVPLVQPQSGLHLIVV
jgi:hypothetical protein